MTYELRKTDENVLIAEGASVTGDVRLAKGVSIWYGAVLRGDMGPITVGTDTNIQDEAILHEEHYHDYTPASIDRCYAEKENLEVNREFVRINHKETLAQVFTDLRYTKKDNEAMSDGLIKALRRQGFMD